MRMMVLVKANKESEAGEMPSERMLKDMGNYNEQLAQAGIMLAGEGLHPSSKGVRIKFDGDRRNVRQGPFTESNDLIAGYWLWQVDSMDQAIEWLQCAPFEAGAEVEIRPVFEDDDFGAALTPELREQEARLGVQTGDSPRRGTNDPYPLKGDSDES